LLRNHPIEPREALSYERACAYGEPTRD
jgi:hypothetical protein